MEEYYKIQNLRCLKVTYHGPTNNKEARFKITETDHNGKKTSRIFSYNYEFNSIGEMAYNLLIKNGWNIKVKSCLYDCDLLLCDNWGENFKELENLKD